MEIKTEELLKRICTADASELNEIMAAVTERFRELWPDGIFCSSAAKAVHCRHISKHLRRASVLWPLVNELW